MILVLAMLLDAAFGEPAWLWTRLMHPAVAMGRLITMLDDALNKGSSLRAKGTLLAALLVATGLSVALAIGLLGPIAEVVCGAILIAQRSLVEHVSAVADALRRSIEDGREHVAQIVSRDCATMTTAQVARSAIESASENLSDGVIAPVFWFAVAGLPGLLIYKIVNTADSMIGYQNDKYQEFGWASARLDDLLNVIPARLTGLMIATLSGQLNAWVAITNDARAHRSPNAGWPEAAMARAIDVALAGPRSYDGKMRDLAWVNGSARREIDADDIDNATNMLWKIWGLALMVAIVFTVAGTFI